MLIQAHIKTLVQLACPVPFPMDNGFEEAEHDADITCKYRIKRLKILLSVANISSG